MYSCSRCGKLIYTREKCPKCGSSDICYSDEFKVKVKDDTADYFDIKKKNEALKSETMEIFMKAIMNSKCCLECDKTYPLRTERCECGCNNFYYDCADFINDWEDYDSIKKNENE